MSRSSALRRHSLPILFLILSLVVVFWELFTLQQAFLSGDHREQQYPWAKYYQEQIHEGQLPWWTTHIHSGFPILAEGQIGAFYPINFLTFKFLPTKVAYNYGILLHYLLGGLFFYFYLQRLKLSRGASLFATLIFLFGSTQGGYFYYNYISQKVVIWLPLTLLLMDRILEKEKFRDAFFLSLVFACQIFGGYLQVAIYSILFSILYFFYHWFFIRKPKSFFLFTLSGILGIFFSLCQLLPTYELALLSSRADAAKEIAYIGSMSPLGLVTLLYPYWDGLVGSELYVGILGLFFVLGSFAGAKNRHQKGFIVLSVLFLLLALGEWSPLYRGIVELTGFHGFRTPIKFLFFVTFSLAILAAYGFDLFFRQQTGAWSKPARIFLVFTALGILGPPIGEIALTVLRPHVLPKVQSYVVEKFHGKPGHPRTAEEYRANAVSFYDSVTDVLSINKTENTRIEWGLILSALVYVILMVRFQKSSQVFKLAVFLFLFLDLFLYGMTSIKPNYEPFDSIDTAPHFNPIRRHLDADKSLYRLTELYDEKAKSLRFPIYPSTNMLDHRDDLGAYSPLIMKSYQETLQGWGGYLNDSFGIRLVEKEKMLFRISWLRLLNVKYLLSHETLEHPFLKLVQQESNNYLYEVLNPMTRAFFFESTELPQTLNDISPEDVTAISDIKENAMTMELQVEAPRKGYLMISEIKYPGWTATVNDQKVEIHSWAGIFRAVELEAGFNLVKMEYRPRIYQRLAWASLLSASFLLLVFLVSGLRRKST